ncbi:MAG: DNA cytosine methyltransferase [Elusimicrobia bacterium]|nr:DNA cytosine methyltransferase [Elusimicrobiota bacterium]
MIKAQHTVLDLFSGCGGMSWGLHKAGFRALGAIDLWKRALETFQANHPTAAVFNESIQNLPPKEILRHLGLGRGKLDCLIGGPPCQGFSKNVPAKGRFFEDPRNLLFRNFLEYAAVLEPKVLVMENVAEIFNAYDGAVREEVRERLGELGYDTEIKVLYAPDYGLPQRRRRCFFFASRTGVPPIFPNPTFAPDETTELFSSLRKHRSAWSCISDLPKLTNGQGHDPMEYDQPPQNDYQRLMRCGAQVLHDHVTRRLNEKQYARISAIGPGQAWRDLPKRLQPKSGYSGAYGRLDTKMLAPTITRWVFHPGSGRFSHPVEPRVLTIREVARIQSFSDDFLFTGTYIEKAHQLGNAVPPLLMGALAENITKCLEGAKPASRRPSSKVAAAA